MADDDEPDDKVGPESREPLTARLIRPPPTRDDGRPADAHASGGEGEERAPPPPEGPMVARLVRPPETSARVQPDAGSSSEVLEARRVQAPSRAGEVGEGLPPDESAPPASEETPEVTGRSGPPPPSGDGRHLGPMSFGTILSNGFREALRAPLLSLGVAVARGTSVLAWGIPGLLIVIIFQQALAQPSRFFHVIASELFSPAFLLATMGIAGCALLLSFLLEVATISGAVGLLAARIRGDGSLTPTGNFARSLSASFPTFLAIAGLMAAAWSAWSLALGGLALAAGLCLFGADGSIPLRVVGAGGLALAGALWVIVMALLPLVSALAMARAGTLGERATAAIHQAVAQLGRRPFAPIGAAIVFGVGGALLASAILSPRAALLELSSLPPGLLLGIWLLLEILAVVVTAFAVVARLGAYVSTALDDVRAQE